MTGAVGAPCPANTTCFNTLPKHSHSPPHKSQTERGWACLGRDTKRLQASNLNIKTVKQIKSLFLTFLLHRTIKTFGDLSEKPTFVLDKGIAQKRA